MSALVTDERQRGEDIYFYGTPKELDKFIKLTSKSDLEKISDFRKIIDNFNLSDARYKAEKILNNGDVLRFSKHNKPPLSVDFKYTLQYVYGNKNGKPGIVKIKMTGNDDKDFIMAFRKSGIPIDKIDKIKKNYTWHHLDDFDPLTGECTMQLVESKIHEQSYRHIGSAGLYKAFMGIGYPGR